MVRKYYKILGLEVGASLNEAQERYNCLIEEFNPENQEGDLKEFFKKEQDNVKEAYNKVLENIIELKEEDKKTVVISKLSDTSTQNQVAKKKNKYRLSTFVSVVLLLFVFAGFFVLYNNYQTTSIPKPIPEPGKEELTLIKLQDIALEKNNGLIIKEYDNGYINVKNLNFRSSPDFSKNIIKELDYRTSVKVIEKISHKSDKRISKCLLKEDFEITYNHAIHAEDTILLKKNKQLDIIDFHKANDGGALLTCEVKIGNKEIIFTIHEEKVENIKQENWVKIIVDNQTGYVYEKFVTIIL
jgi:uncharacterized protein YgiM (DUF1202 family)